MREVGWLVAVLGTGIDQGAVLELGRVVVVIVAGQ